MVITSRKKLKDILCLPLYANSLNLLINYVIIEVLAIVFWMIAARLYSAADVGLNSAAISAMSLLSTLALLGLNFGLIRFLAGSGDKASELINTCLTIGGSVSIVIAVAFLLGINIWSPALRFISQNTVYFASFIILTIATTTFNLLRHAFIAERHTSYVVFQGAIFSIFRIILVIILAICWTSFGIFSSWGLASLTVVAISTLIFLPRILNGYRLLPTIQRNMVNQVFHFSFLNYFSNLLWEAPSYILPIMVVNLLSAEQNGYFYIVWAIGVGLRVIPMAVSLSLLAEGSFGGESLATNLQRSLNITLILLIPVVILVLIFGEKFLLLFGQSYSEYGTKLLWLMTISALPATINFMYISGKRVEKKLNGILLLTAVIAIVTIGLSYVLLPRLGLPGTGVAWLIAQGIAAVVIIINWFSKRTKTG